MALSPWPATTSAAARTAAANRLSAAVGGRTLAADGTVDMDATNALGETASALVEQYAADAPQAIKDEAVVRCGGYLAASDFGAIMRETSVADKQAEYVTNHSAMFRNCGAATLLSPWKIRRARCI